MISTEDEESYSKLGKEPPERLEGIVLGQHRVRNSAVPPIRLTVHGTLGRDSERSCINSGNNRPTLNPFLVPPIKYEVQFKFSH